jgi:tyrosyl-tRNA synthetase
MDQMPFEETRKILKKPEPLDQTRLKLLFAWLPPKATQEGKRFCEIAVDSTLFNTNGEVRRKIKEGGVKWNGEKVTDPNFIPEFIWPGWGVVQLGKNNFAIVINEVEEKCISFQQNTDTE